MHANPGAHQGLKDRGDRRPGFLIAGPGAPKQLHTSGRVERALRVVGSALSLAAVANLIETNVRKEESGDFIAELCLRDDAGILMRLELSAPTLSQARGLTRAYEKQADSIYQQMMTLLLGGSGEKHADV